MNDKIYLCKTEIIYEIIIYEIIIYEIIIYEIKLHDHHLIHDLKIINNNNNLQADKISISLTNAIPQC